MFLPPTFTPLQLLDYARAPPLKLLGVQAWTPANWTAMLNNVGQPDRWLLLLHNISWQHQYMQLMPIHPTTIEGPFVPAIHFSPTSTRQSREVVHPPNAQVAFFLSQQPLPPYQWLPALDMHPALQHDLFATSIYTYGNLEIILTSAWPLPSFPRCA